MDVDQPRCRFRQSSEAIDQFLAQQRELVAVAAVGQPLVQDQPRVHVGQVVLRDQRRHVQLDLRRRGERLESRSGILPARIDRTARSSISV